jgi:Tfp pilus assembly protein PilF
VFFFLGASLAYMRWSGSRRQRSYCLALVFFILGLLSKTAIVSFPLAMLAVVWWKRGRLALRRDVLPLLPFFAVGIAAGLMTLHVESTYVGAGGPAVAVFLVGLLAFLSRRQSRMYSCVETLYLTTIQRNPACWLAHNNLGILRTNAGRFEDAVTHYRKALESDSTLVEVHKNQGNLYAKTGMTCRAVACYRKALEADPSYVDALNNLGNALFKSGKEGEASDCFARAIAIDPGHSEAHYNLGLLAENAGRRDEAAAHYRRALETDPSFFEAHGNLGVLLAKNGRFDEAMACFRKALEISPWSVTTLNNLAGVLVRKGRLAEAVRILQKAHAMAHAEGNEMLARKIAASLERLSHTAGGTAPR